MNKKHIRLFVSLFLISMIISIMSINVFASSQATTTVTYNALSPTEKNHYEINIPSSVEVDENGGSMQVTLQEGYEIEPDYQVKVSLADSSWVRYQTSNGSSPAYIPTYDYYFKMPLQGSESYALALDLTDSKSNPLTPAERGNKTVVVFRQNGIYTDSIYGDGTINFTRNKKYSTDKKNKSAGTYTGQLIFEIEGEYF